MKIKFKGIESTFKMDEFEFSFGKKELKQLAKRGRTDEELNLRKENEALKKQLNDAHSQMGDMRKQIEAMRMDAMRK